jgi:hypothetical protein
MHVIIEVEHVEMCNPNNPTMLQPLQLVVQSIGEKNESTRNCTMTRYVLICQGVGFTF